MAAFKPTTTTTCGFSAMKSDETWAVLTAAKVLIWDEAPMSHKHLYQDMLRDAPAGIGKTTLSKALLAYIRKDGDIYY